MQEEKYITCNINGENIKYKILYVFTSIETEKKYIIYTDETFDENNNLNLFASILNKSKPNNIEDITNDEDWQIVESFISENMEVGE